MSISVLNQASLNYKTYAFKTSETYTDNAVDEAEVSKSAYDVSSISDALEVSKDTFSTDFSAIGRAADYAKYRIMFSQSSAFDSVSNSGSSISSLLSNDSSLSSIYSNLNTYNLLNSTYLEYAADSADETASETEALATEASETVSGLTGETAAEEGTVDYSSVIQSYISYLNSVSENN